MIQAVREMAEVINNIGNNFQGDNMEDRESSGLEMHGESKGAALLLIVGEPISVEQKDLIFERIVTELSSWDEKEAGCDIDRVLGSLAAQSPQPQCLPNGEKLLHHEDSVDGSTKVTVDVLINARVSTLRETVRSFLQPSPGAPTYRHLVYAGLAFLGSGAWLAQDGLFTFQRFAEAITKSSTNHSKDNSTAANHSEDGKSATNGVEGKRIVAVSVFEEGDWTAENIRKVLAGGRKGEEGGVVVRINPGSGKKAELDAAEEGIIKFADSLSTSLHATSLEDLMPQSHCVGAVSFHHPLLYIFPGGDGQAALFSVPGFNALINGGHSRRPCFWNFVKCLSRLDALLITHTSGDNVLSLNAMLEKKATAVVGGASQGQIYPELGVVLMNVGGTELKKTVNQSRNGLIPGGGLLLSLSDEASNILANLQHLSLVPHPLQAPPPSLKPGPSHHLSLYHKVGHGSLDLHALCPPYNAVIDWSKLLDSYSSGVSAADSYAASFILVWTPAKHSEPIIRIMIPGVAPKRKILEGLDRLRGLTVFQSVSGVPVKKEPLIGKGSGRPTPRVSSPVAGSKSTLGNTSLSHGRSAASAGSQNRLSHAAGPAHTAGAKGAAIKLNTSMNNSLLQTSKPDGKSSKAADSSTASKTSAAAGKAVDHSAAASKTSAAAVGKGDHTTATSKPAAARVGTMPAGKEKAQPTAGGTKKLASDMNKTSNNTNTSVIKRKEEKVTDKSTAKLVKNAAEKSTKPADKLNTSVNKPAAVPAVSKLSATAKPSTSNASAVSNPSAAAKATVKAAKPPVAKTTNKEEVKTGKTVGNSKPGLDKSLTAAKTSAKSGSTEPKPSQASTSAGKTIKGTKQTGKVADVEKDKANKDVPSVVITPAELGQGDTDSDQTGQAEGVTVELGHDDTDKENIVKAENIEAISAAPESAASHLIDNSAVEAESSAVEPVGRVEPAELGVEANSNALETSENSVNEPLVETQEICGTGSAASEQEGELVNDLSDDTMDSDSFEISPIRNCWSYARPADYTLPADLPAAGVGEAASNDSVVVQENSTEEEGEAAEKLLENPDDEITVGNTLEIPEEFPDLKEVVEGCMNEVIETADPAGVEVELEQELIDAGKKYEVEEETVKEEIQEKDDDGEDDYNDNMRHDNDNDAEGLKGGETGLGKENEGVGHEEEGLNDAEVGLSGHDNSNKANEDVLNGNTDNNDTASIVDKRVDEEVVCAENENFVNAGNAEVVTNESVDREGNYTDDTVLYEVEDASRSNVEETGSHRPDSEKETGSHRSYSEEKDDDDDDVIIDHDEANDNIKHDDGAASNEHITHVDVAPHVIDNDNIKDDDKLNDNNGAHDKLYDLTAAEFKPENHNEQHISNELTENLANPKKLEKPENLETPENLEIQENSSHEEAVSQLNTTTDIKQENGIEKESTEKLGKATALPSESDEALLEGEDSQLEAEFDPLKTWGEPPQALPPPLGDEDKLTSKATETRLNASRLSGSAADVKRGATKPTGNLAAAASSGNVSKKPTTEAKKSGPVVVKRPTRSPFYVDLVYVPTWADTEFFQAVRAATYVFSSSEPNVAQMDELVEVVKASHGTGDAGGFMTVKILPTYDSDDLIGWRDRKKEELISLGVEVLPSAERCSISLAQEEGISCKAFRMEF